MPQSKASRTSANRFFERNEFSNESRPMTMIRWPHGMFGWMVRTAPAVTRAIWMGKPSLATLSLFYFRTLRSRGRRCIQQTR